MSIFSNVSYRLAIRIDENPFEVATWLKRRSQLSDEQDACVMFSLTDAALEA